MEYFLKNKNNQESPRSSLKQKNRPHDNINTPKKNKGMLERFKSLDKDELESNIFFTLFKKDGEDTGYCLLCDFNQESHKSNHKRHFYKSPKYIQVKL